MQKYTILYERKRTWADGSSVYRIQALCDFGNVRAGDVGGFVAGSENLSQQGDCWIADDAIAAEFSHVQGNATLSGQAKLSGFSWIAGNSRVTDQAVMTDYTSAYGNACIGGFAHLCEGATVFENGHVETEYQRDCRTMRGLTTVRGNSKLLNRAAMYDQSTLGGNAEMRGRAALRDNARLDGNAIAELWCCISGHSWVTQNARITDRSHITGDSLVMGRVVVAGKSYITCRVRLGGDIVILNEKIGGDVVRGFAPKEARCS